MKNEYIIDGDIVKIKLTFRNKEPAWAIFDIGDFEKVKNTNLYWTTRYSKYTRSYYARANIELPNGKKSSAFLHRIIMDAEEGEIIDHINNDTLDNRRENLRKSSREKNALNRKGRNSNNKSGYRNVSWIKKKWTVQLQVDGKNTILGRFDDVHEAGKFAEEMREKYYGKYKGRA